MSNHGQGLTKETTEQFPLKRPEPTAVTGEGFAQMWSFLYSISPSVKQTGVVQASTEQKAEAVAAMWCERMNFRFIGAKVRPMILADESILLGIVPEPAVEARPAGFVDRIKEAMA